MIEISGIVKSYEKQEVLQGIDLEIPTGDVYGIVGTNGAGKTTILNLISGVLKPDRGQVMIDGEPVFNNPAAKSKFFLIPDEPFYYANSTARSMAVDYAGIYPGFDMKRFEMMLADFHLEPKDRISTYSKGMKKQLYIIFGLCANTEYLICDETFDGLDPLMRSATKKLFAGEMADRGLSVILSSHSLRELEDICGRVALIHNGQIVMETEVAELGERSLEQFFIEETEVVGYDITNIIGG